MEIAFEYYDGDKNKSITDKIKYFVRRYYMKFEIEPNMCYVSMKDFEENKEELKNIDFIEIDSNEQTKPNYFWIGLSSMSLHDYLELKYDNNGEDNNE